jgi:hypothetical protein
MVCAVPHERDPVNFCHNRENGSIGEGGPSVYITTVPLQRRGGAQVKDPTNVVGQRGEESPSRSSEGRPGTGDTDEPTSAPPDLTP